MLRVMGFQMEPIDYVFTTHERVRPLGEKTFPAGSNDIAKLFGIAGKGEFTDCTFSISIVEEYMLSI